MIIEQTLLYLLICIIIIFFSAFKQFKPTCKRFIFNTYAYVSFMILSIILIHSTILENEQLYHSLHQHVLFFVIFVISLFVLVYLLSIPASKTISKHITLIIWLLLFGSITFPITERALSLDKDVLNQIITIFIVIVVCASGIVFLKPDMVSRSWGFPLMVGLLSLILSQIIFMLFGFNREANNMISFFSVILFTLFISYDTKTAYVASNKCIEGTANYINYSLSLFLDFINLFSSLER